MDTHSIESLYLEHADDFRTLLGQGHKMAIFAGGGFLWCEDGRWYWQGAVNRTHWQVAPDLAICAFTEAWRERLEREHEVCLLRTRPAVRQNYIQPPPVYSQWFVERTSTVPYRLLCRDGQWRSESALRFERPFLTPVEQGDDGLLGFASLPQAICAAVAALAKEKREAEAVQKCRASRPRRR